METDIVSILKSRCCFNAEKSHLNVEKLCCLNIEKLHCLNVEKGRCLNIEKGLFST